MITEQEVLDYINKMIREGTLQEETKKYTSKLMTLDKMIKDGQSKALSLGQEIKVIEEEVLKLKGAQSMLIELSAESEGLLRSEIPETPK